MSQKTELLNRWIFEIPLADIQTEKCKNSNYTPMNACICCNKPIKQIRQYVHYLTNGNIVSSDQDFDNSQGLFPIGNECKNKVPNNFIIPA